MALHSVFVPVVTQVRPGTENEEDIEEKIQTVVCSDVRPGASPARDEAR